MLRERDTGGYAYTAVPRPKVDQDYRPPLLDGRNMKFLDPGTTGGEKVPHSGSIRNAESSASVLPPYVNLGNVRQETKAEQTAFAGAALPWFLRGLRWLGSHWRTVLDAIGLYTVIQFIRQPFEIVGNAIKDSGVWLYNLGPWPDIEREETSEDTDLFIALGVVTVILVGVFVYPAVRRRLR